MIPREGSTTEIYKIGFELEAKFKDATSDEITDFICGVNTDRPWINTHWHTDSICSKEFKTHPMSLEEDPFLKLKEFHELCKEKWHDYDLKSVHCHVTFTDITDRLLYKMVDSLMPIAVIFRSVKQNSLLDAWSQFFNCFNPTSRGMVRARNYYADIRGDPRYGGMELRFAGKHYWIYEDIIETIGKIQDNVSDWHMSRYKNSRYYQYPDNITKFLSKNKSRSWDVSLGILDAIESPINIKKLFWKETGRRRSSAILISYMFPWLLNMWRDYLPETCRYIDDELLPNLSDKLKHHIRRLRRNKYKLPFIRAWKNMLKSVGRVGFQHDLTNALEKFSMLKPLNDMEIKRIDGYAVGIPIQRCYIPQFNCVMPSIDASGLRDINFRFNCPSLKMVGTDSDKENLTFQCDTNLKACFTTCCLYCVGDSVRDGQRCTFLCTVDDLRMDRMLPRNPYLNTNFPQNIYFDICHNCTNNCEKCDCLESRCNDMGKHGCQTCSRIRTDSLVANPSLSRYMMGKCTMFSSRSTYMSFGIIMHQCDKFVFHNRYLYAKCLKERCGLQGCCYMCREWDECEKDYKCTDLGERQGFFDNRFFRPNIINPKLPAEIMVLKDERYQQLPEASPSQSIYSELRKIWDERKKLQSKWDACYECPKWRSRGTRDCKDCEYLSPYRCHDCIRNIVLNESTKLCSECKRPVGYWMYWHKAHKMLIPHSVDEYISGGKDEQVEWNAPPQLIRVRRRPEMVSFTSTYGTTGTW